MSYDKVMAASAQYTLTCQLYCLMPLTTGSFLALCMQYCFEQHCPARSRAICINSQNLLLSVKSLCSS